MKRCSGCNWEPFVDVASPTDRHTRETCPQRQNRYFAFYCPYCGYGFLEYKEREREHNAAATDKPGNCPVVGCHGFTFKNGRKCDHCRAAVTARIARNRAKVEVAKIVSESRYRLRQYMKPCKGCGCVMGKAYSSTSCYCTECATLQKKYGVRARTYGMSLRQVEKLVEHGECHICGASGDIEFHIDHDHETGAVRGLLCKHCNFGIGWFRDSPEHLAKAIQYLNRGSDYRAVDQES